MRALLCARRGVTRSCRRNNSLVKNIQKRTFAGACFPDETRDLSDWRGLIEYEDAWSNILMIGFIWIPFFTSHYMVDRWFLDNELAKLEPGYVLRPGSFIQHTNPNNYVPTFPDDDGY